MTGILVRLKDHMRRFFLVWLGSALVALGLAGCGGGSGTSGLPASKRLVDLTDGEKAQFCDWAVAKFGGYGTRTTCNSVAFPYADQAACVADSPSATSTPTCQATVGQMEACVNSLPECTTMTDFASSPQCASVISC
jgi:hypothetical protein